MQVDVHFYALITQSYILTTFCPLTFSGLFNWTPFLTDNILTQVFSRVANKSMFLKLEYWVQIKCLIKKFLKKLPLDGILSKRSTVHHRLVGQLRQSSCTLNRRLGRILIGQRENVLTQQRKFHLKGGAAQKKKIETSSWAFVNVLVRSKATQYAGE